MKESIEFYVQFIAEVENNPELYNHGLADYSNKRITENIWTKIGEKFNEKGADCKSKWKSIRSAYIRSLNTKSKSITAGGSKKEYYLAPYLLFLNPFTKNRPQENNTPITQEDERNKVDSESEVKIEKPSNDDPDSSADEDSMEHDTPAASLSVSSPHSSNSPIKTPQLVRSQKHTNEVDCAIDYYTYKKKKLENQSETQQHPSEMFLLSLVPHLTSMSQQQILTFQRGVLELIENIKYRQGK